MKKDLLTYCNPLSIPDIPRGKDDWYPYEEKMFSHENRPDGVKGGEYRSVSDPTVMYYNNRWYLYPSYGMAWVTEDFVTWEFRKTEPFCPKYSPAITRWKDRFLMTSWMCPLYVSDDPLGPFEELGDFIMPDGKKFRPCDPGIFTDDDGRIYLYAFDSEGQYGTSSYRTKIIGYELDTENPQQVVAGPVTIIEMNPRENPWERQGFNNQNTGFGWVEGPHLLKTGDRYYLIYAAPDTRDPSYCMAVYYSDISPLEGFVCQKRNPLTLSRSGIVSGAGHGCVEKGPGGSLWAFYTIACPRVHQYERRIGMDRVCTDENGELFCPEGITDTPCYGPGEEMQGRTGYLNLTSRFRGTASSSAPGRDAIYASDNSNISCWVPSPDDARPFIELDMDDDFTLGASRVFWSEMNYDPGAGIFAGPVGYMIEGLSPGGKWITLLDCSDNKTDYNIDYRRFEEKVCRKVRLTITSKPAGMSVGVIDFSVFGRKDLL